jgi:hypothetical protein
MDPNHEELVRSVLRASRQLKELFWPDPLQTVITVMAGHEIVAVIPLEIVSPLIATAAVTAAIGMTDGDVAVITEDGEASMDDTAYQRAVCLAVVPRDDNTIQIVAPYGDGPTWSTPFRGPPMINDPLIEAVRAGYIEQARREGPAILGLDDDGRPAVVFQPCPCGSEKPITVCCADPSRN